MLGVSVDESPLPSGDFMAVHSHITLALRRTSPTGPWMCQSGQMVVDIVTGPHGPIDNGVHRSRDVTRAINAALADIQANDAPANPPKRPAAERLPLMRT